MSISVASNLSLPSLEVPLFTKQEFDNRFNFELLDTTVENCCRSSMESPKAFYLFVQRYAHFNGVASSLVTRLASSIGLSRDIFRESNCEIHDEADRGLEVAAKVLEASIEEFSEDHHQGISHRTLAQATMKAVGNYAGLSLQERNELSRIPDWFAQVLAEHAEVYQGKIGNLEALMKAMGFHAASEILADHEYTIIDKIVRGEKVDPNFGQYLKDINGKVDLDGKKASAWYWIGVHSSYKKKSVEEGHYLAALEALDLAVKYCGHSEAEAYKWAFSGFENFVKIQQTFFKELQKECFETLDSLAVRS